VEDVSGGNEKVPQSQWLADGLYPVVDQGKALVPGYVNEPERLCKAPLPVVVSVTIHAALSSSIFHFVWALMGRKFCDRLERTMQNICTIIYGN
jgi:hypothetical protein